MSQYDKVYTYEGEDYQFNYSDVEELVLLPVNKTNILTGEKVKIDFSFNYNEDLGIVVMRGEYNDIVGTSVGIDKDKMADTIFQSLVDRMPIDNMPEIVSAKDQIIALFSKNYLSRNLLLEDYTEACEATIHLEKESIGEAYKVKIEKRSSGNVGIILEDAFLADANIRGEYTVNIKLEKATISFKTNGYEIESGVVDKINFTLSPSEIIISAASNMITVKVITVENAEDVRKEVNSKLSIFNDDDEDEDFLDFDLD